jgi:ADP-heptose:LPS heptosyltransferase
MLVEDNNVKIPLGKIIHSLCHPAQFRREEIKSILVIRMNKIGDMIYTIPLIKTLKNEFPEARITVLAEDTNAEIIKYEPYLDRVIVHKRDSGKHRNRLINIINTLGGEDFDLAIGVKGGFSSFLAVASLLSGAQFRIGHISPQKRFRNRLYNLPVEPIDFSSVHQAEACLNLLKAFGVKKEIRDIGLTIPPRFLDAANDFLRAKGLKPKERIATFNISSNREKSTWRPGYFVELGKHLIDQHHFKCIITAVSSDEEKASEICRGIGDGAYVYKTANVMDFAAIVSMCNILITGEGGASHIGAAAGTRVITLFGEANPVVWRPYGEQHIVLRQSDCDAKSITVEEVMHVIRSNESILSELNACDSIIASG